MTSTVDWNRYRKCPVCFAALGQPCTLRTGALLEGVGDVEYGVTLLRDRPHSGRPLRTGYARTGDDHG